MKKLISDSLDFANRYNLFIIKCSSNRIDLIVEELASDSIKLFNIGQEVSRKLIERETKHLTIEVEEFVSYFIQIHSIESFPKKPKIIALYNFGILFEPSIRLNVEKILKDISKHYGIIIIWDAEIEDGPILHWDSQKENYKIDLSDIKPLIIDKTL